MPRYVPEISEYRLFALSLPVPASFVSCSSFNKMDSAKGSYKISANASLSIFNTVFGLAPFEVS